MEKTITAYQTRVGQGAHVLCPKCSQQIHFVTTLKGKKMPVQLQLEYGNGRKTLVTHSGKTLAKAADDIVGFQPHWGFCKR